MHESIKRARPPPAPAGIDRIDEDGRLRWIADDFRFPRTNIMFGSSSGFLADAG